MFAKLAKRAVKPSPLVLARSAMAGASVHGMRTANQRVRGSGWAGVGGSAQVALDRGFENVFLQVEETNTLAVALYQRAGFATAWRYGYWR